MYLKIMHSSGSSRSRGLLNRGKGYHNLTVKAVNLGAKVPNEVLHTISSYLHLVYLLKTTDSVSEACKRVYHARMGK